MPTATTIVTNNIYIGEILANATNASADAVMAQAHQVLLEVFAISIIGTAIRATTTGLMPLRIRMITGLSWYP